MGWHLFSATLFGVVLMAAPQGSSAQAGTKQDSMPAESSTAPASAYRPLPSPAANDKTENLTVEDFLRGFQAMQGGPENVEKNPDYINAIRGLSHVVTVYVDEITKARKEGGETDSCPPHGTTSRLTTDTLVPFLLRIPPNERQNMSMDQAFHMYMREQYPCPGKAKAS